MSTINFFNQTTDIFSAIAVFLFGIFLINKIANAFKSTNRRALGLYIWHSFFCIVYAYLSLTIPADAAFYYISSKNVLPDFKLGTNAIVYITTIFTNGLGLSYLGVFLVFNIFGTIGLLAVDASLRHATEYKSSFVKFLGLLIVLLPSMNFWTSAIGKDSIAFMSTGLLLWASIDLKRSNLLILFAVACMFFVRPHIAALIVIAFTFSLPINKALSPYKKIFFLIISLIAMRTIIPNTLQFIGLGEVLSVDLVQDFINIRQAYTLLGGSGIDISSMSLISKLFTYSFRPLPYEAHNFLSLLSSIDNLILLIVFILSLFGGIFSRGKVFSLIESKENRWFLLIFALGGMVISSLTTANLGISVRQKWMYMPILLYFVFLFMKAKDFNQVR